MSAASPRDQSKREPLAMTDAEVAAMGRGGDREIVRRIARHRPPKPVGRLVSDKPTPPRISVSEMQQIQRAKGGPPDRLRQRLQRPGQADTATEPARARKPSPSKEPPGQSS